MVKALTDSSEAQLLLRRLIVLSLLLLPLVL
jgi:hypothetical protein